MLCLSLSPRRLSAVAGTPCGRHTAPRPTQSDWRAHAAETDVTAASSWALCPSASPAHARLLWPLQPLPLKEAVWAGLWSHYVPNPNSLLGPQHRGPLHPHLLLHWKFTWRKGRAEGWRAGRVTGAWSSAALPGCNKRRDIRATAAWPAAPSIIALTAPSVCLFHSA